MTLLPGDVILTGTPAGVGPIAAGPAGRRAPSRALGTLANTGRPTPTGLHAPAAPVTVAPASARRPTGHRRTSASVRTALFNWALRAAHRRHLRLPHRGHRRRARLRGVLPARCSTRCAGSAWTGTRAPRSAARTGRTGSASGRTSTPTSPPAGRGRARLRVVLHPRGDRGAPAAAGQDPKLGYDNADRDPHRRAEGRRSAPRAASRSCGCGCRTRTSRSTDLVRGEITLHRRARCRTSCWCAPTASRCTRSSTRWTTR